MRFCQPHWDALREAIKERGLYGFVPDSGEQAVKQMQDQLERDGELTLDNFDPLMGAHWEIVNNVMRYLEGAQPRLSLYLMAGPETPEDPVEGDEQGRTWPRCPLCYLNLAHETSCKHERCQLDPERGYDWMIDRAAEDQLELYEKNFGEKAAS